MVPHKDLTKVKSILAVSIGGLGDTILFSPVLKALRVKFPESRIDLLLANPSAEEVYMYADEVDRTVMIDLNCNGFLLKAIKLLPHAIKSRLSGGYDLAVFATGLNPQLGAYLEVTAGIGQICSAPKSPQYETDLACNVSLARKFIPQTSEKDVFIPILPAGLAEVEKSLKQIDYKEKRERLVAIYPSTDLSHRPRWEISKLLDVAQRIKNDGFPVKFVVIGSRQEGLDWAAIDKSNFVDANLAGGLSLHGTAALISQCCLTLGNDGGLMHLAGTVQCPLVVIMPNTPLSYRPPGVKTTVIRSRLTCCNGRYPIRPDGCQEAECIEDISVKEVYQACRKSIIDTIRVFVR